MPATPSGDSAAGTLRAHGLKPRRRLGQNFLRDRSYLRKIVEAAAVNRDDEVLELGAGTGVLTRALLELAKRVVAVELDDSLFQLLTDELGDEAHMYLWHGNALDFNPSGHFAGSYKLVGNIPYYITGPILRHFLESEHQPSVMVLMVQREVADRIVARPGHLSLLGVSVQFYARAEVVARVPAGAFYPVPKVDSSIVRLAPFRRDSKIAPALFFDVVRAAFGMRRKQLANSLSAGLRLSRDEVQRLLDAADIDGHRRAETLSVDEWIALATRYANLNRERQA